MQACTCRGGEQGDGTATVMIYKTMLDRALDGFTRGTMCKAELGTWMSADMIVPVAIKTHLKLHKEKHSQWINGTAIVIVVESRATSR